MSEKTPGQAAYEYRTAAEKRRFPTRLFIAWDRLSPAERADEEAAAQAAAFDARTAARAAAWAACQAALAAAWADYQRKTDAADAAYDRAVIAAGADYDQRLVTATGAWPCCDLHGRNCEPPSELCCENCTEVRHAGWTDERGTRRYGHPRGETCSNPILSVATLDSQPEPARDAYQFPSVQELGGEHFADWPVQP